jgi:hypothetical protein
MAGRLIDLAANDWRAEFSRKAHDFETSWFWHKQAQLFLS